jgi:hypothetical protein
MYCNPLINSADIEDACEDVVMPAGLRPWIDQSGRHPFVEAVMDRDGDVVMGQTPHWVASVREGFEAYGGHEDDGMLIE